VVEVDCPNRQARRRRGKTDPLDAIEAARAAQGGRAAGQAKTRDGTVEAIRALSVARRSAKAGRVKALNQIRQLGFTGSDDLRERLRGPPADQLADVAAGLRPSPDSDPVTFATETALRLLGRRVITLTAETTSTQPLLSELVAVTAPELLALYGVGVDVAASLLIAAGDNPDRLRSEAAWAHLCGVAPLEASSGKITRHRLNRGGDRQANQALWRIALVRMRHDERTRTYVLRRTTDGKTKQEIIRMLKRYIARDRATLRQHDHPDTGRDTWHQSHPGQRVVPPLGVAGLESRQVPCSMRVRPEFGGSGLVRVVPRAVDLGVCASRWPEGLRV
jgi:transposase